MSASTDRVQAALLAAGCRSEVVFLERPGRTALEAASAIGIELGQIVKSLVFNLSGEAVLLLVAGDRRVDTGRLEEVTGRRPAAMATPEQVKAATGFAIGGVAPIGHPKTLETLVDESLCRFEVVWAAAGAPEAVFEIPLGSLIEMTGGTLASFT